MISALTGQLQRIHEGRAHVQAGPLVYELLIPAADVTELQSSLNQPVTFHTIFYLGGDPSRGGLEPTLIGFLRADDKAFFQKFTTVKGIGPKTALRALSARVGEIARAIEQKDTRFLVGLDGIGKRTAELIVAELAGKVKEFAFAAGTPGVAPHAAPRREPAQEDAIEAFMALGGGGRPDAERLLDRVAQQNPTLRTTDALLREMLRTRTVRA